MVASSCSRCFGAVARALAKTKAFKQSCRDRKRVEMLFAHLKRILRLGRLRLRGPRGAQFEFTLAAIAQNLRRLARLMARPPPMVAVCCRVVSKLRGGRQYQSVTADAPAGASGKNGRTDIRCGAPAILPPTFTTKSARTGHSLDTSEPADNGAGRESASGILPIGRDDECRC